ncbi:hypothetical protein F5Y16DRAFT_61688 [Xylariaceae sp. FL0255]|nr:hypothetical protein F5Y16DRAFT_61688 [Xylariaceae sp. FL0255]
MLQWFRHRYRYEFFFPLFSAPPPLRALYCCRRRQYLKSPPRFEVFASSIRFQYEQPPRSVHTFCPLPPPLTNTHNPLLITLQLEDIIYFPTSVHYDNDY